MESEARWWCQILGLAFRVPREVLILTHHGGRSSWLSPKENNAASFKYTINAVSWGRGSVFNLQFGHQPPVSPWSSQSAFPGFTFLLVVRPGSGLVPVSVCGSVLSSRTSLQPTSGAAPSFPVAAALWHLSVPVVPLEGFFQLTHSINFRAWDRGG